jgi:hypothetical protein
MFNDAMPQSMGIVPRCAAWAASFPSPASAAPVTPGSSGGGARGTGAGGVSDLEEDEQELLLKLAKLLAELAVQIMDALKRVENGAHCSWHVDGLARDSLCCETGVLSLHACCTF